MSGPLNFGFISILSDVNNCNYILAVSLELKSDDLENYL